MLNIVGKYRWRQSCRYKKLSGHQEKATTGSRQGKRQKLGKKPETRAKGFRVNRSRKLVLKALALPRRMFKLYVQMTDEMKREGLVFSSHWGFPVMINSKSGFC